MFIVVNLKGRILHKNLNIFCTISHVKAQTGFIQRPGSEASCRTLNSKVLAAEGGQQRANVRVMASEEWQ